MYTYFHLSNNTRSNQFPSLSLYFPICRLIIKTLRSESGSQLLHPVTQNSLAIISLFEPFNTVLCYFLSPPMWVSGGQELHCPHPQPLYTGQWGDQTSHPKGNRPWIFIGYTHAEAEALILWPPHLEEPTLWKRPWCWERLRAGEGRDRGWDGCMISPTWCTWVWTNYGWQWRTNREAWHGVHEVEKSQTRLSNWTIIANNKTCWSKHF